MEHELDVLHGIERGVQMVGHIIAGIREEQWPAASPVRGMVRTGRAQPRGGRDADLRGRADRPRAGS